MQRADKESGYQYALPVLDERILSWRGGVAPEMLGQWIINHAKSRPVSKHADRQVVPRSRLKSESIELGHAAVAEAHERGYDGLFRAYASRGLRGKTRKNVLGKWEFLRSEIEAVIPLDEEIASQAIVLANLFVDGRFRLKGTTRNTMNDMMVAATSQVTGMPLVTGDAQLRKFYGDHGWSVRESGSMLVASPSPRPATAPPQRDGRREESRGFINRPRRIRPVVDYGRPPLLR